MFLLNAQSRAPHIPRRRFLAALSAGLAAPMLPLLSIGNQEKPPPERLPLEKLLSPEDRASMQKSSMSMDLENYFGRGYSCAESMLMVALRRIKLPENFVWAAASFGGGVGQKDLCGFLTGGCMGLGLAAGELKLDRKEAKKLGSEATAEYWQWWKAGTALRCAEIRPPGSSQDICRRLGVLAAARLNLLIDRLLASGPGPETRTGQWNIPL